MTVTELITKLQTLPPDLRVFVQGYEGGLEDPVMGTPVLVDLNVQDSGVYGPHALKGEGWEKPKTTILGVVLKRSGR